MSAIGSTAGAAPAALRRARYTPLIVPALFVLLVVSLGVAEPRFLSTLNLINVSRNAAFLAIVSIGQMLVMILGGLDLSVGVVVALSSVATALVMTKLSPILPEGSSVPIVTAVGAALCVSGCVGLVNGLCVALLKTTAFMITLGMFSIIGGLAYYITAGIPIYGMPSAFTSGFGRATLLGLPYAVVIALILVVMTYAVQQHSRFGRHLLAIGGHGDAARMSGVPIIGPTIVAYVACSFLAGLAGVLITARVGAGQANLGSEFMLQSIGAAVLAGVSLRGGVGRVESVALAALFLTVFSNAMNLVRIDSKIQTIVFGVVLLAAVFLDRHGRAGESDA